MSLIGIAKLFYLHFPLYCDVILIVLANIPNIRYWSDFCLVQHSLRVCFLF